MRHTFNVSLLYSLPYGKGRKYGANAERRDAGAARRLGHRRHRQRAQRHSGAGADRPSRRRLSRCARALIFANPAADRVAVINTPGGGASRNVRRPDLVPGVDPYIKDGGLLFLNPAAFATPQPGTFGNLERNSIVGPGFKQVDFFFAKHFRCQPHRPRVPRRGLQPVRLRELREPDRHAAAGDSDGGD